MTTQLVNKPTLATVKSFIRRNAGNLYIKCTSRFDGMVDGVEFNKDAQWQKAELDSNMAENTLGIRGAWFVRQSRDSISPKVDGAFVGYHVYNCCGSFDIGIMEAR